MPETGAKKGAELILAIIFASSFFEKRKNFKKNLYRERWLVSFFVLPFRHETYDD